MTDFPKQLLNKIKNSPIHSGCYLYKNAEKKIIYIGKAKNLRNRVNSYFVKTSSRDLKTQKLVKNISDVEFIVTNSEIDALILENTLIKQHKPRYNILLRDDKSFPYIKITNEVFPRVYITRKPTQDGSKYFGPYTESRPLRKVLHVLKKMFPVRTCNKKLTMDNTGEDKQKVCLNYHIQKCAGPCIKKISKTDYDSMVEQIVNFLNGKTEDLSKYFNEQMRIASSELNFEMAAKYRDNIKIINDYYSRQSTEFQRVIDCDLIYIVDEADNGCAVILKVRQGKIIGNDTFFLQCKTTDSQSLIIESFIQQYYSKTGFIPQEIIVNEFPENIELIKEWLAHKSGRKVRIIRDVREEKRRLLLMAQKNATLKLKEFVLKKVNRPDYVPKTLEELQNVLSLEKLPRRIEGFDISNIRGTHTVASLVTFINGAAKKSEYRKFQIKTVKGIDDFASMSEVLTRRYTRQIKENNKLPDLIMVDGGKGQLSSAKSVLDSLELDHIPIIGLAKRLEEIFVPEESEPLVLSKDSPALILLRRIRDESHRFAITYHRKKRAKGSIQSELDNIPGLGEKKKKALFMKFKTVARMKAVSVEDLCDAEGIGPKLAQTVWTCLHERK